MWFSFFQKKDMTHTIYLTWGLLGQTTDSDRSGQVNPQRASSPRDGQGRRAPPATYPVAGSQQGQSLEVSHSLGLCMNSWATGPRLSPPYLSRLYMEAFPAVKLKPKGPLYPTLALIPNPVTPSSSARFVPSVVFYLTPLLASFCLV